MRQNTKHSNCQNLLVISYYDNHNNFERVFIFPVTLDTRKNERQMSVSSIET
jgi:hypothetical protein